MTGLDGIRIRSFVLVGWGWWAFRHARARPKGYGHNLAIMACWNCESAQSLAKPHRSDDGGGQHLAQPPVSDRELSAQRCPTAIRHSRKRGHRHQTGDHAYAGSRPCARRHQL